MQLLVLIACGALVIALVDRQVAREDRVRAETASDEMWDRSIDFYSNHVRDDAKAEA